MVIFCIFMLLAFVLIMDGYSQSPIIREMKVFNEKHVRIKVNCPRDRMDALTFMVQFEKKVIDFVSVILSISTFDLSGESLSCDAFFDRNHALKDAFLPLCCIPVVQ